jgi:hypothetical protein
MRCPETICLESLNPKVQGSIPCASTIFASGDAPAREDVPFDAHRCHQLSVSRTAETTCFGARNASQRIKLPNPPNCSRQCPGSRILRRLHLPAGAQSRHVGGARSSASDASCGCDQARFWCSRRESNPEPRRAAGRALEEALSVDSLFDSLTMRRRLQESQGVSRSRCQIRCDVCGP